MNRNKIKVLTNIIVIASLVLTAFLAFSGNIQALASPPSGHGSTFEDADGNLVVNTTGMHDWNGPTLSPIICPASAPGSVGCSRRGRRGASTARSARPLL